MRSLTSLATSAALLMTAALMGCVDPTDPFDSLTTATTNTTLGDGDSETSASSGDGDGDTGDGDGDGDSGDGDGDTGCAAGNIGDPCDDTCPCAEGLSCNAGECALGSGDGDGDGDGDTGGDCNTYDPMMCMPPGQLIGVMGIDGQFCGCPCMADADCPMGPMGTQGGCVLSLMMGPPSVCGLLCSVSMDACPEGATCQSAGQMDPDIGLCTWPMP
jgi:hypothetical protein